MHQRLTAAGKEHKVALVASPKALIIFANAIVAGKTAWQQQGDRARFERGKPNRYISLNPTFSFGQVLCSTEDTRFFVPTWLRQDAKRSRPQRVAVARPLSH
jgi:hypothetical protein